MIPVTAGKASILPSIIRTIVVPMIVGALGASVVGAPAAAAAIFGFGYYVLVRIGERFFGPKVGILLGYPKQPTYQEKSDWLLAISRTFVPLLVTFIIGFAVRHGIHLDEQQLETLITGAIGALYYGLIRLAEQKKPEAGVAIGGVADVAYAKVPKQ